MFTRVFFDGTYETAGQVLAACKLANKRVWVVTHRQVLTNAQTQFLNLLKDVNGSLGHFEQNVYKPHLSTGSPRHCSRPVECGTSYFFDYIADMNERDEEHAKNIISMLHAGNEPFENLKSTAEEFGMYIFSECE